MSDINLFELAAKEKYRFSVKGMSLCVEDLFSLPLRSTRGPSLDEAAITLAREIREGEVESFVSSSNPSVSLAKRKLELVKLVIEDRQEAALAKAQSKEKAERKQAILRLLAEKDAEADKGKSRDELLAELDSL